MRADVHHVAPRRIPPPRKRRAADLGPGFRDEHVAPAAAGPADDHVALLAQVDADARGELRGARGGDLDLRPGILQHEARRLGAGARRRQRQDEVLFASRREHALQQALHRLDAAQVDVRRDGLGVGGAQQREGRYAAHDECKLVVAGAATGCEAVQSSHTERV